MANIYYSDRKFVPLHRLRRFEQSPTNGDAADSELCSPEHLRSARSQRGMMNMNWMAVLYITNGTARFCSFAEPERKVSF